MDIQTKAGIREALALDLEVLPMWLSGIQSERVAPAIRETLLMFQQECASALKAYWFGKTNLPAPVVHESVPVVGGPPRSPLERLELLERVRMFLKEDDQYTEPVSKAFSAMARGLVFQEFQRVA